MTEKERMLSGKLYIAQGDEIIGGILRARRLVRQFNDSGEMEFDLRDRLLRELFGHVGEGSSVNPPFRCDYGSNISVGDRFFANYDCIFIDVCPITIGDNVFFGPRVSLYTAAHPIDASVRNTGLEYGRPITIGNNVWVGGNVVVNPGVTIGDNVVVGSGSVVTKDIPSGIVAAGVPCRVIREITDEDREYWNRLKDEYTASLSDSEVNP